MFKRNVTEGYYVPASVLSMYEEGGELVYDEGGQTEDPMMQLMEAAPQVLESGDCEMMKNFITMFIEALGGGQEMAQEEMPAEEPMMQEPMGEEVPMARQGMEIYDDNQDLMY